MFHARNHESQIERLKNRPFHCNICGKGFATESSLRTHTGKVSAGQEIKNAEFGVYEIFTLITIKCKRKPSKKVNHL